MEPSVDDLCSFLVRSRLLNETEVNKLAESWRNEAKQDAGKLRRFRKWLVANRHVTDYQVGCLFLGHCDHFFLNDYKLLDRIGKGRMAGIFKAEHRLGQVVAIKVLPPSKAKNPELFARFQREARMAARLKHPNVVRTFQIDQAIGVHYLVMEYLEGETLEEVFKRRGRLPVVEGTRIVYQTLSGLQHIHEQGLVHRDLKPANLMLVPGHAPGQRDTTEETTVKILDIGLGRALFDENAPGSADNFQLTADGAAIGEPAYVAPEQARDAHSVDIRADIYSVGCVLYEALAGATPFADASRVRQLVRHAKEQPRLLREVNPQVPDGISRIVNTMLAKDPAQRYPTPERAALALRPFLAGSSDPVAVEHTAPEMESYLTWLETESSKPKKEIVKPAPLQQFDSWRSLYVELLPPDVEDSPSPPIRKSSAPAKTVGFGARVEHAPGMKGVESNRPAPVRAGGKQQPGDVPAKAKGIGVPAAPVRPAAKPKKQEPEVDVELVPMEAPAAAEGFGWNRHAVVLLGLGFGAGASAVLLGWLIVHWLGK
jgi:serine/threonine protein kinase